MSTPTGYVPDELPILSRGKHRNPRKGACFMEFASYLAGERWSDHPACTHPLLAAVARSVNDYTSDEARPRLAVLIPSVIGLTSNDLRVDAGIALRCATEALPFVPAERQRVMAVSVLACERVLDNLDGRPPGTLAPRSRQALERVPHAASWARRFTREVPPSATAFRRHAAPSIVSYAVEGVARAAVPNVDEKLRELLVAAIEECAALARRPEDGVAAVVDRWSAGVRLTGSADADGNG